MAFDGIVIANLVRDLNEKIASGRISKIAQPEKDELLLPLKGKPGGRASAHIGERQSPLLYFTSNNKPRPDGGSELLHAFKKHIANS